MSELDDVPQIEAARILRMSPHTLANRRARGLPPTSYRTPAGRVMYARADLEHFKAEVRASTTRGPVLVGAA